MKGATVISNARADQRKRSPWWGSSQPCGLGLAATPTTPQGGRACGKSLPPTLLLRRHLAVLDMPFFPFCGDSYLQRHTRHIFQHQGDLQSCRVVVRPAALLSSAPCSDKGAGRRLPPNACHPQDGTAQLSFSSSVGTQ